MAIVKFAKCQKTQTVGGLHGVITYCCRPTKVVYQGRTLISGVNCVPQAALLEFMNTKRQYGSTDGRMYYHMVQSFRPDDPVTPEMAHEIALKLAEQIPGYEIVVATHTDREHLHSHFVINSVSCETGLKYHSNEESLMALRRASDELCILQDESYTGTLICHKSERNKINKTNRATSPDEQFRHENFLPSIIPRDLWEQVQELMAMRKRESVRAGEGRPILRYSGLIACGDCGRAFTGKRVKQKNGERVEYICSTYLRYGKEHCGAHPIREEYLDDIVRQELQNTKQQYQSLWTQLEKAIEGWLPKTTNTQQQLRKQRERIELLEEEVETILMERIRDKENAQRYDRMIAKREEQIANAKKRIEELENIGQIIRSRQAKLRKDIGLIDDILADGKISEAHLRMLIERIYVYETEGGLSLEIKVKAPFQNHTDSYENGVLTNSEIEELIGVS